MRSDESQVQAGDPTLAEHTGFVVAVAFSPDGTQVLTGSWDNTARSGSVFKSAQALMGHSSGPPFRGIRLREVFRLGRPWCRFPSN